MYTLCKIIKLREKLLSGAGRHAYCNRGELAASADRVTLTRLVRHQLTTIVRLLQSLKLYPLQYRLHYLAI